MQVIFIQTGCSKPLRKLKDIEERLRSLDGKPAPLQITDNDQGGEDVNGLLEDLQEAVHDYMVSLRL